MKTIIAIVFMASARMFLYLERLNHEAGTMGFVRYNYGGVRALLSAWCLVDRWNFTLLHEKGR